MFVFLMGLASAITTITDDSAILTGNVTSNYFIGNGSLLTGITGDNSSWNESYANTLYADISVTGGNSSWNQTLADTLYAAIGSTSYISLWTIGNFIGSLYTTGANSSASDSNSLFQVIGSDGTPRFQVQDGGSEQASFIARSFMVVNQNNTRLNQSQNNLCSEWGFTQIDCNTSATGADFGVQDDFEAQGLVYARQGIYGETSNWGVYLLLGNLSTYSSGGVNGTFTDSTNYFCDVVSTPFSQELVDAEKWIRVISGTYEGAVAELSTYVNSSCVELKNNPAWVLDVENIVYSFINSPVSISTDGGFFEYYVGDQPESQFEISTNNGTGEKGFYVSDVAGADSHKSSFFKSNVLGFDGVIAISSLVYASVLTESKDSKNLDLEFDARNFNNSHHTFIQGNIIGEKQPSMTIDLINLEGDYDSFIKNGQADTLDRAYIDYMNGTIVDVTAALISESTDVSLFDLDNSILYLGSSTNFTEIGISLASGGSKSIIPLFYYCNSGGWVNVASGISDTTAGFQNSGTISAGNPSDRYACNQPMAGDYSSYSGTPFVDATNYSYIAIRRTQNNLVFKPTENLGSISGSSTNFILTDEYIQLNPVSSPPVICAAGTAGAIYFNDTSNKHQGCDGAAWNNLY